MSPTARSSRSGSTVPVRRCTAVIAPRWRKVLRDLTGHKFRTVLVVLSIAVGIFAVGVVMGGRGILLREFDREFAASRRATIIVRHDRFRRACLAAMERRGSVESPRRVGELSLRYTDRDDPGGLLGRLGCP